MPQLNFATLCPVKWPKRQKIGCPPPPYASSRQRSREICGVRPRSRTGQSLVRCCPGGKRCSSGREVFPVRKRPSRAQRSLLRVSLLIGGGSFSSAISHAILFVPVHRRFMLGIAHGCVDDQRQADHAAEIIVEPVLVSETLAIQRDRRRGAAEHGNRNRVVKTAA